MLRRAFATIAIAFGIPAVSDAAINFWLSTAATTAAGSSLPISLAEIPVFEPYVAGTGKFYIWGRPEAAKSLANLSLNVVAETQPLCSPGCIVPDAISFASATVYNPTFGAPTVRRFEYVDDTTGAPLPLGTTRIDGLEGLRIFDGGPIPAVGVGSFADPLYDSAHDSWLIAEVTYNALATGENSVTRLFLEIGPIGLNHAGETTNDAYVVFGDATDVLLNGHDDRGVHPGNYEALIVPRVLPGDANRDGTVTLADHTVWRSNFGSTTVLAADHNHNGVVDAADYVIWRNNLGQMAGHGGTLAVPEPSLVTIVFTAAVLLWILTARAFGRNSC